jgi:hypothetical protein
MKNRIATWINFVFATIVVIGVFLQVYFITAYFAGAGESALDAHGLVGGAIVHPAEAIVFLSALVAFWGIWKWVGWSFFLLVLGTVQVILIPNDDKTGGWVHGLHGLLALFVLVLAAVIAHHDMRLLGLGRRSAAHPPPAPPA